MEKSCNTFSYSISAQSEELTVVLDKSIATENVVKEQQSVVVELEAVVEALKRENAGKHSLNNNEINTFI